MPSLSSPHSLRIVLELNLSFSISLYFARMFSKNLCALSPSEPCSAVSFLQASICASRVENDYDLSLPTSILSASYILVLRSAAIFS